MYFEIFQSENSNYIISHQNVVILNKIQMKTE